jgi:hypothetical protein
MESNDHVNAPPTPNKVLQQVSPIPQIPKAIHSRRKQTAAVLTEADFIKEKEWKATSRSHKVRATGIARNLPNAESSPKSGKFRYRRQMIYFFLMTAENRNFLMKKSVWNAWNYIRKLNIQ